MKHKIKDFAFKCPFHFMLNLETEYRERRLAGLVVRNHVRCPSLSVACRVLFGVRHETRLLISAENKSQRGCGRLNALC